MIEGQDIENDNMKPLKQLMRNLFRSCQNKMKCNKI